MPVLLPLALPAPYDYLAPEGETLRPGDFVVVPLGPALRLGVVWHRSEDEKPDVAPAKLRRIQHRLEDVPPLPEISLRFCDWVANYTLTPPGMVLRMMMSASKAFEPPTLKFGVRLGGEPPERMTSARARVLEAAEGGMIFRKSELAEMAGVSTGVIEGLVNAGTLLQEVLPDPWQAPFDLAREHAPLSDAQDEAAKALLAQTGNGFSVSLLDGVTGSGKTEVYFEAIAKTLEQGKQALVLMPEIALTTQFIARCEARFGAKPAEWHSGMTSNMRGRVWRAIAQGDAKFVVAARSGLFLPFPDLGLIVVDEEHDQGYKQEDRVTYQARDMAVVRGNLGKIPVILSSATPSIESVVNAEAGRYAHIRLKSRYNAAQLPEIEPIDMRATPPERGRWLSPPLVEALAETLERGEQSLLFLNRRGYAPLTLCRNCGYRFECPNCSAWLVEHRFRRRLECHHCGTFIPIPDECPQCGAEDSLTPCGPGVERIDEEIATRFPEARRLILSSDQLTGIDELRRALREIEEGAVDIVIGTQLVAKGHHFPGLALVGVIDGDLGLAQADPRAAERTFQLLSQVTGRAGRAAIKGKGLIQTYMPEHPVLQALAKGDRDAFLAREIEARKTAGMPPFGRLASLLISSGLRDRAETYARDLARAAPPAAKILVLGPAEAPLAVIRGRYRYRLLVKAPREADMQTYLRLWLGNAPKPKGDLRLTVDIDPYSFL
ncbi:primosomal protein N' [Methyloligella sp. GL2]|uniref:primosomal protein N' n=1 Tax=Methyloligella sp. GL2 TaxID=2742204 RepID=UPI001FEFB93C|nr:primosomal protein N' [Methyloligella sp. GL2]